MITPTIGRRVWFWPSKYDATVSGMTVNRADPPQPLDAGVCFVWNERMVNLTVADHCGAMHARTSVPLLQDDDAVPHEGVGYATWMPYQTGQAKAAAAT